MFRPRKGQPMGCSTRWESIADWLWFLVCGILSSLWCVTAAGQLSATFDEPIYVRRGLEHWHRGSYQPLMQLGTMPLPVDAQTFPLFLWEKWRGAPFDPVTDFQRLLPPARTMTLLFWWLLLAYGRLAGRALAGPWAGRLAVGLLACEPSFLAHAGLATTDLSISACLLALVYHFRTGREAGWFHRLALPAFWFAAALLAKASAIVYGPLFLLAVEVERLARGGALFTVAPGWRSWLRGYWGLCQPFRRDLRWILGCGLAGAFLYCGTDWKAQPSFVEWAHRLPPDSFGRAMVWSSEHLRIFTNAGEGIVKQVRHNIRGHGAYLLGHWAERALWWYFPVVLAIKLSVPVLLAPLAVLLVRPRALANWALMAAGFVVLLSPAFRVQIGIRLVLPIVALGIVGLAAALVEACRNAPRSWQGRLLGCGCVLGVLWTTAEAVQVWPEGLCYVNPVWGGTRDGYRLVSEGNYDWGQGLKELAQWHRGQDTPVDVWYFGSDPLIDQLPLRLLSLHDLPIHRAEDLVALVRGHYLAVSTTMLYGAERATSTPAFYLAASYLRGRTPIARTATFFIYDFTRD